MALTYRVEAEAMGPDVFARAWADLVAPPAPAGDVNELSADEKRALIKAQMAREREARRGGVGVVRGG